MATCEGGLKNTGNSKRCRGSMVISSVNMGNGEIVEYYYNKGEWNSYQKRVLEVMENLKEKKACNGSMYRIMAENGMNDEYPVLYSRVRRKQGNRWTINGK